MTTPPPTSARSAAAGIVRTLREAGHVAYFAGGCVRDELLGVTPDDYDVATDAVPDRVMALFPRSGEVGKSFGVVLVRAGGEVVEVATFRADGAYADSRRPDSVRFSTPEDDAARRDYTVNALFLDPFAAPRTGATASPLGGEIIDLVGGLTDLAARVLRAVGDPDRRLAEDHLRGLRAARLAAKLGFDVDERTADAVRAHASALRGVSRERIGDEVRRMLAHPSRAAAASLVAALDLEAPVFGQPPSSGRTDHLRSLSAQAPYGVALGAWALDMGTDLADKPLAELLSRWRGALCLSNDDREDLAAVLRLVRALRADWPAMGVAGQKRTASRAHFGDAVALAGVTDAALAIGVRARVAELAATPSGLAPRPWVSGDDLVTMGRTPGPGFKAILDGVYDAQLEGRVGSREAALELARGWCV